MSHILLCGNRLQGTFEPNCCKIAITLKTPQSVGYNLFVRFEPHSRQPLNRALGYKPLKISSGLKRLLFSVALGVPCALIATGISDSTAVSDFFRYAISPGTAIAVRVVHVEPSHRGVGVFLDAVNGYANVMSFACMVNATLYIFFIFAIMTTFSALKERDPER